MVLYIVVPFPVGRVALACALTRFLLTRDELSNTIEVYMKIWHGRGQVNEHF